MSEASGAFKFTGEIVHIPLPELGGASKKGQALVEAGVYSVVGKIQRSPDHDKSIGSTAKFVRIKAYNQQFISLDALNKRLNDATRRKADHDAVKESNDAVPIEFWDSHGNLIAIPGMLIPTRKDYNDNAQLAIWVNLADHLFGVPPANTSPMYARFVLRPMSNKVRDAVKVYFSPSDAPVKGLDSAALKAVIDIERFRSNWPHIEVVEYNTAKEMGLKEVGRHFMQFYCTWMSVADYKALWEEFNSVSALPFKYPADGAEPPKEIEDINAKVKTGKESVDGREVVISSKKLEGAVGMRDSHGTDTDVVRGISATIIADELWKGFPTTRMGKTPSEWLHRTSWQFGGLYEKTDLESSDDANNLIFGSWECNLHMIRAENTLAAITKKDPGMKIKGEGYKGILVTENKLSGEVSRMELARLNSKTRIPEWVATKKYSWLSFSLNYRFLMKDSPVGIDIVSDVDFDPWSLYVPLHIEPRIDDLLLQYLRAKHVKADLKHVEADDLKLDHSASSHTTMKLAVNPRDPLPTLPLPLASETSSTLAWQAAHASLPTLEFAGLTIDHPTIAQPPAFTIPAPSTTPERSAMLVRAPAPARGDASAPSVPPPQGFIIQGKVKLFGTALVGNLEKWVGPPPAGVSIGSQRPIIERVSLTQDFHLSTLIPPLRGTPFDVITFRGVSFYYQNYAVDKTKQIGWHLNANWVIDPSCGILYNVLTAVLGVHHPVLSIHAWLGDQQKWTSPLSLHSFILEGVFPNLTISPFSGVQLMSIGVQLLGVRGYSLTPQPHSTLSFGFGIFGTMKLQVPGSVMPLDLDYRIGVSGSTVNLSAEISGQIWANALGVKDLELEDVLFTTTFATTSPWKSFAFDISATLSYLSSQAYLRGSYASGGQFALTAQLDNFGVDEIHQLFITLFNDTLALPSWDLNFESATLSIVSGQGFTLSLHNVVVAGYAALEVQVAFTSTGVSFSGALSESEIKLGDVAIKNAVIQLAFWSSQKGKAAEVMLAGTLGVDFLSATISAAVHLYPSDKGVEWAVVAELKASQRPFAIADIVSDLKGTFLDFSLADAVFITASKDDPLIGQLYPQYHVQQGVQVFGVIDRIPPLNDLLRQDIVGLILSAGWSRASGFDLAVALPAASSLNLGSGIKTTPISLAIRTSPIELAITAGLTVPVRDSSPLDFNFVLAANVTGASASAEMKGWWVKPFNIDNLKIGPVVSLSIEIVYAQFVSTGTPSGLGVSGGLMIGSTEAFVAFNITDNPQRELLYGEVKKLSISDVVAFCGQLLQEDIPKVPDDLLRFEELRLYICPFGVVLGTVSYPQGFSFKADLMFFGKRANIECSLDKAQKTINIVGGVDNFELGPLSVHGSQDPRAGVNCTIGVSKQKLSIDGVVALFDLEAQTHVEIQFLPEPIFKFFLMLQFAKVFIFKLNAALIGSITENVSQADFSLDAELENDILDYITQQIMEQFEAAKTAANAGLEAAQAKVDDAKKAWEAIIAEAQNKVNAAQQQWESYEQSVRGKSQPVIDHYLSEISRLQGDVEKARESYNNALENAQKAVEQANQDRAAALASANRDVGNAQRNMDQGIQDAQHSLDDAQAALSSAFGDAQRAIDSAQQAVNSIQGKIDDLKNTIHDYEDAPWYEFWKKAAIAGLWTSVGTLEASKAVANAALDAAHVALTGTSYLSKVAAVDAARGALEAAKSSGEAALSAAQVTLSAADNASQAAVDQANHLLDGVRTGVDFTAFQSANAALEAFKAANEAAYNAAIAAIQGLMQSAEFVAFNAAKAGLEVAQGSTQVLDAAKEALAVTEKATEATLSALSKLVQFAAHAVNIQYISFSGSLRGFLGEDGKNAKPLSAVIKGFFVGQAFEVHAEFDVRDAVAFITAIFKQLLEMLSKATVPLARRVGAVPQPHLIRTTGGPVPSVQPPVMARSKLLRQEPDVRAMLTDEAKSKSALDVIPRGPFSGAPIMSSNVVASKALLLMQQARGVSVFDDFDGMQQM